MKKIKLLIIGESPSKTGDGTPLSGNSGKFLFEMLGIKKGPDIESINLCKGKNFGIKEARATIESLDFRDYQRVLLLGVKVEKAFDLEIPSFLWIAKYTYLIAKMPHPSKRNRYWNSPYNVEKATLFLKRTVTDLNL